MLTLTRIYLLSTFILCFFTFFGVLPTTTSISATTFSVVTKSPKTPRIEKQNSLKNSGSKVNLKTTTIVVSGSEPIPISFSSPATVVQELEKTTPSTSVVSIISDYIVLIVLLFLRAIVLATLIFLLILTTHFFAWLRHLLPHKLLNFFKNLFIWLTFGWFNPKIVIEKILIPSDLETKELPSGVMERILADEIKKLILSNER